MELQFDEVRHELALDGGDVLLGQQRQHPMRKDVEVGVLVPRVDRYVGMSAGTAGKLGQTDRQTDRDRHTETEGDKQIETDRQTDSKPVRERRGWHLLRRDFLRTRAPSTSAAALKRTTRLTDD